MDKQVDISLSIVTYNNSMIIKKTVNSLINSIPDELSYMLYIVDNNSSDNTIDIVNGICGCIEVIEFNDNYGFGRGHNAVIDRINSKYHFVVNPDIHIEDKNQIRLIVNYLCKNDNVGMLSPLILNSDLSIQYLCKTNPTLADMFIRMISPKLCPKRQDRYIMKESGYNKTMNIEYASGCFMAFRTCMFKLIRGFDDKFFMYLEDADITRRVNIVSEAVFFPEARVVHAWERGGHKSFRLFFVTIQSMLIYFRKWGLRIC